jgi:hypothetical protein
MQNKIIKIRAEAYLENNQYKHSLMDYISINDLKQYN